MIRHAGWCTTHLRVLASGSTPYCNVYGHNYVKDLAMIGETVLARLPRNKQRRGRGRVVHKGDMGFARAVWLGRSFESDEHIVALASGVVTTTRTIKRLAPGKRFDRQMVADMKGMPWNRFHVGIAKGIPAAGGTPAGLASVAETEAQIEVEASAADGAAPSHGSGEAAQAQAPGGGGAANGGADAAATPVPASPTPSADDDMDAAPTTPRAKPSYDTAVSQGESPLPPRSPSTVRFETDSPTGEEPDRARQRVGGVAADHVDDVRPDYLEILRAMDVNPADASDDQMVAAGMQRAIDGLKRYGVMKLVPRSEVRGKKISSKWLHTYQWSGKGECWSVKSRYVAREFRWQEERTDLFTPGSTTVESRLVDFIAAKNDWPTFTLDAEDAYYHAPELENVWVEAPPELIEDLGGDPDGRDYVAQL